MAALRHHLLRHRLLAAWFVAAALLMKMLVPTGYMASVSAGSITIELCSGYGPQKPVVAMPGMTHHPDDEGQHGREMPPCAFAGLSAPSLAGADPLLLAVAIAFVLATIFRIVVRPALPGAPPYLRPPLRGPPAHA
ncbi:hypothetical protein U1701_07270 [Sphingomonas sp. PB2P19]|uniref:DUF2946 family protein n=1 Tax=Sphingomonas rhamnosi TaxID=3096156 RepID=UPI002FC83522